MDLIEAEILAKDLLREHKLDLEGWRFEWDTAKKRFGRCNIRERLITVSAALTKLNSLEHFKDTMLHEIAHALAPVGAGHNHRWQYIALAIGCNGKRCYGDEVVKPPLKYTATCPACGRETQKARKGNQAACGRCCKLHNGGRWAEKFILIYKLNY